MITNTKSRKLSRPKRVRILPSLWMGPQARLTGPSCRPDCASTKQWKPKVSEPRSGPLIISLIFRLSARTSSSPLCDQRLNRTKSAPSIGIEHSSTPTQSLNAIQAQLENVVGDPKSMSLEELQRFGAVLIGLQNQLAQAIEAKSRHEDN